MAYCSARSVSPAIWARRERTNRVSPGEDGLVQSLRHGTVDGEASVHLVDVPGPGRSFERHHAAQNSNTGSPIRSARTRPSVARASVSSSRAGTWRGT